jgi:hypothetical protein
MTTIMPFWGLLTPRVASAFFQDFLVLGGGHEEIVFHPSTPPSDVITMSRRLQAMQVQSRVLAAGELPTQVWVYSTADVPVRCPADCARVRQYARSLDEQAVYQKAIRPDTRPERPERRLENDPIPPFREFIPQSGAPAWTHYTAQELRYLTTRPPIPV